MFFRFFGFFIISLLFSLVCYAENPENGMLLKEGSLALPDSVVVRINPNAKDILFSDNYKNINYAKSPALFKKALAKELGFRKASEIRKNVFVVSGTRINISKISEKFKSNHYILVEHNFIEEVHDSIIGVDDPFIKNQWGLYDPSNKLDINIETVWKDYEPLIQEDVIVGVIDSGVSCTHEDLASVCFINEYEIPNNNIDDDENGYVDDVQGWNMYNNSNDAKDDYFHGTHVAGIIAAEKNNLKGIAGVSSKTKILPIKAIDSKGKGGSANVIRGIEYAIKMKEKGHNIKILNLSLGSTSYSVELYNAIKAARNAKIIVVVSAGNNYSIADSFPASYDLDNIISVAAHSKPSSHYYSDSEIQPLASFSNYGKVQVDITAPGTEILSCYYEKDDHYIEKNGTSMSAPFASGALAILAGLYPNEDPATYISWLLESSLNYPPLENYIRSGGLLNVYGATALAEERNKTPLKSVTISGYVADTIHASKVEGLPNIKVRLKLNNGEILKTESDETGFFIFNNIPVGAKYKVSASDKKMAFKDIEGTVKPHNYFLTIQPKSITLSGRLLNTIVPVSLSKTNTKLPKGVPNKKIILTTTDDNNKTHQFETKTDKNGEFFFYNLSLEDKFTIKLDDDEFNEKTGCTYYGQNWTDDSAINGYSCSGKIIYGTYVLVGTPSKKITIKIKTPDNQLNPYSVVKITAKKNGTKNIVSYTQNTKSSVVTRVARGSNVKIEVVSNPLNYTYPVTTFKIKKNRHISISPIITPESKLLPPNLSVIKRGVLRITLEQFQYATKATDGSGKHLSYKYQVRIKKKNQSGEESEEIYDTEKINNRLVVEDKTDYLICYRIKILRNNKTIAKTDWGKELTLKVISL